VNDNFVKFFQYNNSGLRVFLTLVLIAFLLSSVGLKWVVNGFLVFVGLLIALPVIAWFGMSWWLQRNLIQDNCPVCSYEITGFNKTEFNCPNCGEALKVESGHFQRSTPPGTIDVKAVEVSVQQLED
jgi:energy-coupling factor transporter transmembrane protein EcfT